MAQVKGLGILVGLAITALLVLLGTWVYNIMGAEPIVDEQGNVIGDGDTIVVEDKSDNVVLTYLDEDKEDYSNDPATNITLYDPNLGNVADDGTKTLARDKQYKAVAGKGSSTYYAESVVVDTSKATGNQLEFVKELAKAGTVTATVYNKDGSTQAVGGAQAVGTSDTVEFKVNLDVDSNSYWGSPDAEGHSIIVCAYNNTAWSSVEIENAKKTSTPNNYSRNSNYTSDVAFIVANLVDGAERKENIIAKSTSSGVGVNNPIACEGFDANVDIDYDSSPLNVLRGVEDEDNNPLSLSHFKFEIAVS